MSADSAGGAPARTDFVARAGSYREELARRADETEALRRLPQDLADRFSAEGFYALCNPADHGGSQASPLDYVGTVEALARGDASAGWCTFIAVTAAYGMAFAGTETVRHLLSQPGVITAGVFAPMGRARPATKDGVEGYLVNGRWAWGSGSQNAHWISGGCLLADEEGGLVLDKDGRPQSLSAIFAADQVEFIDTWTVTGLQGTGSTDFQVTDAFIPADRMVHGFGTSRDDYPIFRFPGFGLLGIGIAAVALGAARGAMDDFYDLAVDKVPAGTRSTLAEKAGTHRDVALAEAAIRQGRAFFTEAIEAAWQAAEAGPVPVPLKRDLRLATTSAVRSARTAVDLIYELAGGTAVYRTSPIQRRFRDIHVATQHMMVKPATYELAGRLFLDQPTDTSQL
ncbi:acyl-CoA dehydrogenase family protein [Henriciella aquimarina]|uniref:acyl-CoA dehydrogenase family protein n=1 Tax=Henriciella aquimarina TaxID=545261 RepID=UPI000A045E0D|nr:acyl-CoA dehydrogenase family protein [Henriciella aquimarina]